MVFVLATVCRDQGLPRRAFGPAGRADARASPCKVGTAFVMEARIFRDAPDFEQFAGAGQRAYPYEFSTELAGGQRGLMLAGLQAFIAFVDFFPVDHIPPGS
jgi:hypothetical protein